MKGDIGPMSKAWNHFAGLLKADNNENPAAIAQQKSYYHHQDT